jgi:hypothetical protein
MPTGGTEGSVLGFMAQVRADKALAKAFHAAGDDPQKLLEGLLEAAGREHEVR